SVFYSFCDVLKFEVVITIKYNLSFCEIEQLSDNVFEVTINEGAIIDEKCAEEARIFWHDLRKEPYGLLVNNKNRFSLANVLRHYFRKS
ncbi:MAG: hypothetical protein WBG61_10500, partial [Desulfobacterales bacterium]